MNEPTPAPPPAADAVPYRSLSGLAVAGLILSGLFTAWLVLTAIIALRSGSPLLIQPGWLLVPLLGAVVSGLGWLQVHRSEGSRVGVRPAQSGLLLGVVSALGYLAWYSMTELPLRLQARDFTDGWFDTLRQSQADDRFGYVAFWCSVHPLRRDGSHGDLSNAAERDALIQSGGPFQAFRDSLRGRYLWGERGAKGPLPLFFEHEVVQLVRQAGPEAEVEALGVRDWEHIGGSEPGYKVEQAYRVRTPDGAFEVTVPVLSLDKDRRRWRVFLPETQVTQREYTPRGRFLSELRSDSYRFAGEWVKQLSAADSNPEDVAFLPPTSDLMVLDSPKRLKEVTDATTSQLLLPGKERNCTLYLAPLRTNSLSPYEVTVGKPQELIFFHPFEARVESKYRGEGLIAVATSDPKLVALQGSDAALAKATAAERNRRWRILGVRLLRAGELVPRPRTEE